MAEGRVRVREGHRSLVRATPSPRPLPLKGEGSGLTVAPAPLWSGLAILLLLTPTIAQTPAAPRPPFQGRSWVSVDQAVPYVLDEGQTFTVTVHYQLDAADAPDGKTATLQVEGLGPWLGPRRKDNPRGGHIFYPRLRDSRRVEVGRGSAAFSFVAPKCQWRDELQMLATLDDGRPGPRAAQSRSPVMAIRNLTAPIVLETAVPGNLFTYDEPVVVSVRLRNLPADLVGAKRRLAYTVKDTTAQVVASGTSDVTIEKNGQTVALPLKLDRRGTFLIQVELDGAGRAETMFARVPDVLALTGPRGRTQFGGTTIVAPDDPARLEAALKAFRRLGWSASRTFVTWQNLEPLPGTYALDAWDAPLKLAEVYGIDTVLTITTPPVWARRTEFAADWGAVPRWDAWENMVRAVTTRFQGRLYGWEWLNEITPGSWWKGSAAEYAELCRRGTETARAIDPKLRFLMAGGLWPRSFRLDVLGAGAGKYIDVLPLHYNSAPGVREARADLETFGLSQVAVWDDESSRPLVLWQDPLEKDLTDTTQTAWLMEQWAGELAAGAERLIWFGNRSCVGDYSPFFDDLTPRPVAATLAIFAAKLHGARPLGSFRLGSGDSWHLFERGGRAILVARATGDETIRLGLGSLDAALVTDPQGNETRVAARDGAAEIHLGPLGCFVELDQADPVRLFAAVEVGRPETATLTSSDRGLVDSAATQRIPVLRGQEAAVPLVIRNPFDRPLDVLLTTRFEQGQATAELPSRTFTVAAGATHSETLRIAVPATTALGDKLVDVVLAFPGRALPPVARRITLGVIAPEMLGNLAPNGDFETDADGDGQPDLWRLWSGATRWWPTDFPGTGGHAVRLDDPGGDKRYATFNGPKIIVSPGQKYLYSAWVWNSGMDGGSNINQHFTDGRSRTLMEPRVFGLRDTGCWQLYTKVYHAPAGVTDVVLAPVVGPERPGAFALYDNLRFTIYQGTDYAAECRRTGGAVKIDGSLNEWAAACPLPLLGPNQLEKLQEKYAWSPGNLSAVAWLMWYDKNLYVAMIVNDDVEKLTGDSWAGGQASDGDSIRLAVAPVRDAPESAREAFELVIARGTGGKPVVYRSEARSGGLRSGHLYRDSSEMELAITRAEVPPPTDPGPGSGPLPSAGPQHAAVAPSDLSRTLPAGQTVYEMRIPFSMLGRLRGSIGGRFALTLEVTDNDGSGPAARMTWGRGLAPAWSPEHFGCITFIEK